MTFRALAERASSQHQSHSLRQSSVFVLPNEGERGCRALTNSLVNTLSWVSSDSRAVVTVLASLAKISAEELARGLGIGDRHALARTLARDGLPPFQELRCWVRIVAWIFDWEQDQTALCRTAIAQDLDPAVCYRTVARVTGVTWSVVRKRGLAWVLLKLRARCHLPLLVLDRECTPS
jgi:hypothetical protein